jgi:hypothetical protein
MPHALPVVDPVGHFEGLRPWTAPSYPPKTG